MPKQVIHHRDPIALFSSMLEPAALLIYQANLALRGWVTNETDICRVDMAEDQGDTLHKVAKKVEVRCGSYGAQPISVATTVGGVGNDNGTGIIFQPRIELVIVLKEGKTYLKGEKDELVRWLLRRYPTAKVSGYRNDNDVTVNFNLRSNDVATF